MVMIEDSWNKLGFKARSATLEDVDSVVDLINAAAMADTGTAATNREDKLIEWSLPEFSMAADTLLVNVPDGQTAGFVELWDSKPYVRPYLFGRVHPDYRNLGLGGHLVEWAEVRARQNLGKAPAGARVSLRTSAFHGSKAAHELFQKHGFAPTRHFYRMLIDMAADVPPPAPVWPEGITVRPYVLGEEDRAVHRVLDEAFQDHWGYVEGETFEEWFHWIENDASFDPSVCFLAVTAGAASEEIVGVLMSRPEWEEDPNVAWIDELGVLRPWRRKGIALALLQQVFVEYHRRVKYKVGLGVDGNSLTGAMRLYEKAGMQVLRQLDLYEKVLRPGVELSTQTLVG